MGKRELLLIGAFVVVGVAIWRLTAPPGEQKTGRFSLQRTLESIRTEFQSQDASAEVSASAKVQIEPAVTRVKLEDFAGSLTVEGTEETDVGADLRGTVFGSDEAQARGFAAATIVRAEVEADTVRVTIDRPETKRSPRLELRLRIPKRLVVEAAMRSGRLDARQVAGLQIDVRRTTVRAESIAGSVKGSQRSGELEIADVGSVDLTTSSADVRVERVSGGVKAEASDGEWLVRDVSGAVELVSEDAQVTLERIAGALTFKASDGQLTVRGRVGDLRGEGRRCRLAFRIEGAGTLDVTAEDGPVEVQVDAATGAGYDLRVEEAAVRAPDGLLRIDKRDAVTEASGTAGAGGRSVKVRSRRGDVTVRP